MERAHNRRERGTIAAMSMQEPTSVTLCGCTAQLLGGKCTNPVLHAEWEQHPPRWMRTAPPRDGYYWVMDPLKVRKDVARFRRGVAEIPDCSIATIEWDAAVEIGWTRWSARIQEPPTSLGR